MSACMNEGNAGRGGMKKENRTELARGVKDGIPIAMGYLAVGFTLGIAAKTSGLTAFQGGLASALCMASAGEFAGFTSIAAGSSVLALILVELIINIRYLLMSASLSQKLDQSTSPVKRFLMSFCVTDEIFGISSSVQGRLNPFYTYGAYLVAMPAWTLGTYFGALSGGVLPERIMSALSVALYGMFIAVIIPPARKDRTIAVIIVICFVLSWLTDFFGIFEKMPAGTNIIVLTVIIAGAAAVFFPVSEEKLEEDMRSGGEE